MHLRGLIDVEFVKKKNIQYIASTCYGVYSSQEFLPCYALRMHKTSFVSTSQLSAMQLVERANLSYEMHLCACNCGFDHSGCKRQ